MYRKRNSKIVQDDYIDKTCNDSVRTIFWTETVKGNAGEFNRTKEDIKKNPPEEIETSNGP